MSRTEPPGLQYPVNVEDHTPVGQALRMVVDNLFYLKKLATTQPATPAAPQTTTASPQAVQAITSSTSLSGGSSPSSSSGAVLLVGSHTNRITIYGSPTLPIGSAFFEFDRNSIYVVSNHGGSGPNIWQYAAGLFETPFASLPTDLGANDTGFMAFATDPGQQTEYIWNGTAFITSGGIQQTVSDANVGILTTIQALNHLASSGTPGSGMGVAQDMQMPDSGNIVRLVSRISTEWTGGTTNLFWKLWLRVSGVLTTILTLDVLGNLTNIGTYIWKAGGTFTGILFHNNSGNRTYTFPDASGNIPYEAANIASGNIVTGGGGALIQDSGVALPAGFSGTVTLAKLTTGGTNGSLTVVSGFITAYTAPT